MAALLAVLFAAGLTRNYARAATRGTVPLERGARRESELERSVTRAVADSLATQPDDDVERADVEAP